MVNGAPLAIISQLYDIVGEIVGETDRDKKIDISKNTWKLTFTSTYCEEVKMEDDHDVNQTEKVGGNTARMKLQMHELEEGSKYLVSATRLDGEGFAYFQTFNRIHDNFMADMRCAEEEKKE